MTQETPAKVFSLLGVALTSMFFLFAVAATNANFSQTERPFPEIFNPDRVVAVLDGAANAYSNFVDANLVQPTQQSFAVMKYNLAFVIDEASPDILKYTGLQSLAQVSPGPLQPQVAGASTQAVSSDYYPEKSHGFSVDSLFSLFIQ